MSEAPAPKGQQLRGGLATAYKSESPTKGHTMPRRITPRDITQTLADNIGDERYQEFRKGERNLRDVANRLREDTPILHALLRERASQEVTA